MHRIAATPGGWTPDTEGVIFIEQTPAPIVLITAADTDIQTLAAAVSPLGENFPNIRVANLLQLQQQLTIDTYAEDLLSKANVIILRLLGGQSYWSYGLEVVKETAANHNIALFVLPGDDQPDPSLISHSTVSLSAVNQLWQYFIEGGVTNITHALQFVADTCFNTHYHPPNPQTVPRIGLYHNSPQVSQSPSLPVPKSPSPQVSQSPSPQVPQSPTPQVGILFYRSHYLAGNTKPIDALCEALLSCNLHPIPVYLSSLRDQSTHSDLLQYFQNIHVLLNTTSFSLAKIDQEDQLDLWKQLNVPVLQVILSGGTKEGWESSYQGLSPKDVAMNVALPEVDGRIITCAVSFKSVETWNDDLETDVVVYEPLCDRINIIVDMAKNWIDLRTTPKKDRKIALILANYPNKDGRIANGVGLDTPASCINILQALKEAGYHLNNIPSTGDELIQQLTQGVTNDPEMNEIRPVFQSLPLQDFYSYFQTLPPQVQTAIKKRYSLVEEKVNTPITLTGQQLQKLFQHLPQPLQEIINTNVDEKVHKRTPITLTRQQLQKLFQHLPQPLKEIINTNVDEKVHKRTPITLTRQQLQKLFQHLPQPLQEITNTNVDEKVHKRTPITLTRQQLQKLFQHLPQPLQDLINNPQLLFNDTIQNQGHIPISGIQLNNIFIGIQPSRGYDLDPTLNYHAPDLEPTPNYLAFYYWLRQKFNAHAIIHVGKHGNLEWLPGKSLALSKNCYPEITLNTLPHLYPFIVNDPGEGSQAKRRSHAIILDHLTPPLTRAELYGGLQQLETLIDEYYEAQTLDPSRLPIIAEKITNLVQTEQLHQDLGINPAQLTEINQFLTLADGYLCELKDAQIRDGLHIFGQCPQGRQLRDLIVAIARNSGYNKVGLIKALAQDLSLDFALETERETQTHPNTKNQCSQPLDSASLDSGVHCTNIRDAKNYLEEKANKLIENLLNPTTKSPLPPSPLTQTQHQLTWIKNTLLPNLLKTPQEITHLLKALDGEYVPSGSSGAPTRGRPDVLPTGRNFYSTDIRSVPTETAWDIGRKAAEAVIERYTQENGEYPQTLAISVWGTSTMRTGGDDIAQILALLGVQPIWDGNSRRVVDFEILPLSVLGRPRVDVTLRISGFFRDSFPNLISLVHHAIAAVAQLNEPPDQNPLAHQVGQDQQYWQNQGLPPENAQKRALERIYGSKPGAYGAGLQGLIEAQNWTTDEDLARAYINWSSYAYTPTPKGVQGTSSPEAFQHRLQNLQIVLHNQDNREHDLLDSDDYYQFQGGLTAAVRTLTGQNPTTYFGDNSRPSHPKVRHLREEIAKVYRSRVVNPKWIAGVMRHGYKGAFEMAATVDYLFAYDATAQCVEDFMYEGVANAYLFDKNVQKFIQEKNPWALRDMGERLLEAHQRGLWQEVKPETLDALKALVNDAEGDIESLPPKLRRI